MKNSLKANIPPKKLLSIGFVAMLLLTMAVVIVPASVSAVPAQSIWIDPTYPDPAMSDLKANDNFTVDVMVNVTSPTSPGGTGMFAIEYKLFWNSAYVKVTSYATHVPSGWEPPKGFLVADDWTVLGRHHYAYSALVGAAPFTGVMSLCTYNFTVTDQPIFPDPALNGTLDLWNVKIIDNKIVNFISDGQGDENPTAAGTVQDGMYEVASKVLQAPMLKVEPSLVPGVFGENFTVNIQIEGLKAAHNLSSWEAMLGYNTTMLDALASANGTFLQGFAGTNGTYYNSTINDTLGIVDMEGGFNGSYTEPSGNGVLATVTFNASWQYTIPPGIPPVTSALNLYDTTLLDDEGLPITHDTTDGTYEAPFEDTTPPEIGDPSRVPAGDVLPNVNVKVSVNVTDGSGVGSVELTYRKGNGTSWGIWITPALPMSYNSSTGLYERMLGGEPAGTWISFKIEAYDNADNYAERDGADVHFVYEVIPEFPAALIMPLFMVAALMGVILGKTAWSKKRRSRFVASRT